MDRQRLCVFLGAAGSVALVLWLRRRCTKSCEHGVDITDESSESEDVGTATREEASAKDKKWGILTAGPNVAPLLGCSEEGAAVHELVSEIVTIGRSASNTIVVADPRVSGLHCRLRRIGCEAFVEDLSSSATFVNGSAIGRRALHQLSSSDEIALVLAVEPTPFDISFSFEPLLCNPSAELRRSRSASVGRQLSRESTGPPIRPVLARAVTSPYKSPQEVFEDEFSCGICREVFWKPLTLVPCAHSFCAACLSGWQASRPREPLSCPFCRDAVEVYTVFINHGFRNLLNGYIAMYPSNAVPEERRTEKDSTTTLVDSEMPLSVRLPDPWKVEVQRLLQNFRACDSVETAMAAMRELRSTVSHTDRWPARGYAVPAIEMVCTWLCNHGSNADLCFKGLLLMAFIGKDSTGKRYRRILEEAIKSAYPVCVSAAAQHPSHAALCKEACSCISNVFCVQDAVAAGAVGMACDAMLQHSDSYGNQKSASKLLERVIRKVQPDQREKILDDLMRRNIQQHLQETIRRFPNQSTADIKKLAQHFPSQELAESGEPSAAAVIAGSEQPTASAAVAGAEEPTLVVVTTGAEEFALVAGEDGAEEPASS